MNRSGKATAASALFIFCSAQAYELRTHQDLSSAALTRSVIQADAGLLGRVGLKALSENERFVSSDNVRLTVEELVRFGAQAEDDVEFFGYARPLNHFFDPHTGRGLTIPLAHAIESPSWILEDQGTIFGQIYSYKDALTYMREALSDTDLQKREENWGLTFESLGHVIHHIQDMAQPQHVRNDPHLHRDWGIVSDPSLYENCTEFALNQPGQNIGCGTPLSVSQYNIVVLPHARDYWTTRSTDSYLPARGMADFANRNFVSKDTNFQLYGERVVEGPESYPSPRPTTSRTRTLEELGEPETCERLRRDPRVFGAAARCEIAFYATDIYDAYTASSSVNERASSLSMFDQYLELRPDGRSYRTDRLFTLNRFNYAAAHPFLISRAIGYSAGLIDHFFRGRLAFGTAEADGESVRVEIKNTSGANNAFGPGTFEVYYDSASGTRKPLPLESGRELGLGQFAPDAMHTLRFAIPDDVDLKSEKPFVLVYTGIVGAEEAVTGLVFAAPAMYEGFLFGTSVYVPGVQGPRLIYQKDGQWKLHPQGNLPMGGDTDWKGWYENGVPTRMLTWKGERYGSDNNPLPTIYEKGRVLSVAPFGVRGAALQKDAEGRAWVIAICDRGGSDVVLKRPAIPSSSPAFYDPQNHPDGWRTLGEFPNPPGLGTFQGAWLFNGTGTEAQTMRERERPYPGWEMPLMRLKISVGTTSAQFANLGNTVVTRRASYRSIWDCHRFDPGSASDEFREEISGDHVVAVDYVDQREILARLRVDETRVSTRVTRVYQQDDSTFYDGTETSSGTAAWTIEIDGVRTDLFGMGLNDTQQYAAAGQWVYDWDSRYNGNGTRLLFMDLRDDVLPTVTRYVEATRQQSARGNTVNENESLKTRYVHGTRDAAVAHPTLETDIVDRQVSYPAVSDSYHAQSGTLGQHCWEGEYPLPADWQTEEEVTATFGTVPYPVAAPSGAMDFVSAAIDRKGNFFMSRVIYDAVADQYHYVNYLTGGDIDAMTGFVSGGRFTTPFGPILPN